MIVEYLGIPGSGKTYYANLYKKEMGKNGVTYIDLSRCKSTPLWLKFFYKVTDKTYNIIPRYRKLRNRLLSICNKSSRENPRFLPFTIDYCIGRVVSTVLLYDVFGSLNRVVLNDEGLMQWVVFLVVQFDIDLNSVLLVLEPYKVLNYRIEFIETPVDVALSNIKKRNRHICPMDEMLDNQLEDYLNSFYDICSLLKNYYKLPSFHCI